MEINYKGFKVWDTTEIQALKGNYFFYSIPTLANLA